MDEKSIEQKYDILLGAIFVEWFESRKDYEETHSLGSFSVSAALMRILSATSTADDMLDFILEKQQLRFSTEPTSF